MFAVLSISITAIACSSEADLMSSNDQKSPSVTRASKDNYFDIEAERINMVNSNGIVIEGVLVPWVREAPNAGVANEWIDENFYMPNANRMYTKDNGWELVYSNILERDAYKYIGLYNRFTGQLRFFFNILADPGNQGSSESIWGISINKQTSLFNFNTSRPIAMDHPISSPAFIATPEGSFTDKTFKSSGIANGTWYAFEIECAYDPSIIQDNSSYFTIMGRAINKITSTGTSSTTGGITGTITTTAPSSSINLSFSNMFNSSTNQSVNISNSQASDVGAKIDDGIEKKDSFFKGLWNNIKSNASKWISTGLENGAKKGVEAIISSGGSIAANALKGLFNGLIGGGEKDMISKVDLKMEMKSDIKIESEQTLAGWTDKRLSIPGAPDQSLLYNKPLGVWNLKYTPKVEVGVYRCLYYGVKRMYPSASFAGMKYYLTYAINVSDINSILINPDLEKEFDLKNYKVQIIAETDSQAPFDIPCAFINKGVNDQNGEALFGKFYTLRSFQDPIIMKDSSNPAGYIGNKMASLNFKVIISFDLVHKTKNFTLSYNKIFDAERDVVVKSTWTTFLDDPSSESPFWGAYNGSGSPILY